MERGRPTIGSRPLTGVERVQRYRARHRQPPSAKPGPAILPAVGSPAPDSRLRNLEYDVMLRRAFYRERAPLAEWLRQVADAVLTGLHRFAERYGAAVATELALSAADMVAVLAVHLEVQISEFGDLHVEIDKALNSAAGRWKRFPPERGEDGPEVPSWNPPEDISEAHRRQREATAALEDIKLKVRSGELLADWPARKAVGDLLLGWRQQCLEWFAVRSCAAILAAFGLVATNERQWTFFSAVQRAMRTMLNEVAAGAEAGEGLGAAFGQHLAAPDELPVSQWADAHRVLSARAAAEPGPYRIARTPYLRALMDDLSPSSPVRRVVFKKAAQIGAPLALDTPVATTTGWATMGTLRVGDRVFDEDGFPCNVTGLSPIFYEHDCWRLTFDDGETLIADNKHRWSVTSYKANHRIRTTEQLAQKPQIIKTAWIRHRYRWAIECCQPLDLPAADLPIPPYALGVWLGDGSNRVNQITIHEDDMDEVAAYICAEGVDAQTRKPAWCVGAGGNIILDPKGKTGFCQRGHDLAVVGTRGRNVCKECHRQRPNAYKAPHRRQPDPILPRRNRFGELLRRHGLLGAKHIPPIYLRASIAQRLALLQGLMDTDGSINPDGGTCEFSTIDQVLVDGMMELLASLGIKARCQLRPAGASSKGTRPYWRITFTAYADRPVFALSRKASRLRAPGSTATRARRRRIVSIERVPSVPVRCIEVDSPGHLFLAGHGMIPTHNSEAGNCWIGAIVDQAPGPVMIVQPTVELAKRYSNQRIAPLFDESERLRSRIRPARSRDSGNTMLLKEFLGGVLIITGANSAAGLRSMPVRYLFIDEVNAYPGDIEDEGDPVSLARARLRTFSFRAKEFIASSPKLKGVSRISREYEASDQRKYFVPCPLCEAMQILEFSRLRWQPGRPETVLYQCLACDGSFGEHHKGTMLDGGEWRATAPSVEAAGDARDAQSGGDPGVHGYHLSGLYSPPGWLGWADIVREWEAAAGDVDARKTFVNTVLGEDWEEEADAVPDWERLYERREAWPFATVPERGLFLTAGADVQQDRIEIDVWAWGRGLESWLVEHIILPGDPGRPEIWSILTELLSRTWEHATGAQLALQRLAIDTGFTTQNVYQWARGQDRATVLPVRGVGAYDRLVPVSGPTKIEVMANGQRFKRGLNLWTVSVSFFKKELYKHLGLPKPTGEQLAQGFSFPAGYVHLPDTVSDEWIKQLVAEQQVIVRSRRGFATRTEWRQLRPRNEALDARVYARAAVWLAGADRWSDIRWRSLEEQLGLTAPPVPNPPQPEPATETATSNIVAGDIRRRGPAGSAARRRRVAYWQG